jgi:hypothetical protein
MTYEVGRAGAHAVPESRNFPLNTATTRLLRPALPLSLKNLCLCSMASELSIPTERKIDSPSFPQSSPVIRSSFNRRCNDYQSGTLDSTAKGTRCVMVKGKC